MADGELRDECGAMLVIGVFLAVFMAGMLFYAVGLGQALLFREQLQSAADEAAFGAAVVHAKGMNFVALCNQIMAALLAILVALRLVEMLATLAIVLLSLLSFLGGTVAATAIPALQDVRTGAREAYRSLDRPVHGALRALHGVEAAVRVAVPPLALARSTVRGTNDPARAGTFVASPRSTLPLAPEDFSVLCEHAAEDAADMALLPLDQLVPDAVKDDVRDGLGDVAGDASDWFCGKPGSKPAVLERKVKRVLPTLAARARCEAAGKTADGRLAARVCSEAARVEAASEPDPEGRCAVDCGAAGPYAERVREAREQCDPTKRAGLRGFSWQERTVRFEVVPGGGGLLRRVWESAPRLVSEPSTSFVHPCGSHDALYAPGFEERVHPAPGSQTVLPVCVAPVATHMAGSGGLEATEVLQIFRCIAVEKQTIGEGGNDGQSGQDDDEAPYGVPPELQPDSDDFQLRSMAVADRSGAREEALVRVAAWGAAREGTPGLLDDLGRLAVAQAEYGFDGAAPRSEWTFSRRWTAHLSRVHSPSSGSVTAALVAGCVSVAPAGSAASCPQLALLFGSLAGAVSH